MREDKQNFCQGAGLSFAPRGETRPEGVDSDKSTRKDIQFHKYLVLICTAEWWHSER